MEVVLMVTVIAVGSLLANNQRVLRQKLDRIEAKLGTSKQ
jgi:hypothetical protein